MVNVDSWWNDLLRDRTQAILDFVKNAIVDDYQSVDTLVEAINMSPRDEHAPCRSNGSAVHRQEIAAALRELTREGYAEAYVLGTAPPYARRVNFSDTEIFGLWFLVTSKERAASGAHSERVDN
jgi:hypothetical protein